jgi:endonuclease III
MKDSKVYAGKIKKLHTTLKRAYDKVTPVAYEDPLDAVVYAMMSESITLRQMHAAEKRFHDYFVDLNDLRVAHPEELADILGVDNKAVRDMAVALGQVLNHIFVQQHTLTLDYLTKMGKRQARQALEELDGITPFAVSYCLVTALQGHAIPVTQAMVNYLKAEALVHPEASPGSVEGFLTKQISAKDNHEFYSLLRMESEASSRSRKIKTQKKTARKKTAKKKTTQKKTAKKKTTVKKTVKKKTVKKKTTKRK